MEQVTAPCFGICVAVANKESQAAFSSGAWDLMLTMDNALNEDYYTDMEVFPNLSNDQATIGDTFIIGTYGVQKLYQVSLSYNF